MELYEQIEAENLLKDRGLNHAGLKNKKYTKIDYYFGKDNILLGEDIIKKAMIKYILYI